MKQFARGDPGRSIAVGVPAGGPLLGAVRADIRRPGASLLKLPLVGAILEGHATDLEHLVPIGALRSTSGRSILAGLAPELRLSVRDLCALALMSSDNPSAQHLLELIGPDAVTAHAHAWGCESTRMGCGFDDASLEQAPRAGVTTARDAVTMLRAVATRHALADMRNALANTTNGTRLRLRLDADVPVLHKTGSLRGVCHDVGLVGSVDSGVVLAFLADQQGDTAACATAIGDAAASIWTVTQPSAR